MSSSPPPRRTARRVVRWLLAASLLAAVAVGLFHWARPRLRPPAPPGEDLRGLEPAVVEIVQQARSRVLEAPDSARAWGVLGEVFLANELEEEADDCFAQAQRLDPGEPRWPYFRAGTLINRGDRDEALAYLQQAADHCEADETAPRMLLGETLLALGRIDEAEACFRRVLAGQPDDPRCHFDLGLAAISRQDWQAARTSLSRGLASRAARKRSSVQLAIVHRRLGEEKRANELHEEARRLPADADWSDPFAAEYQRWAVKKRTLYRRAEFLESSGRFVEAVKVVRPLAEQYPDDYLPFLTLGKLLGQHGDHRQAEVELRKAIRLAPDKAQTWYYLSLVLFKEAEAFERGGERARAESLYEESAARAREAIERQPDYGFAYMSLGLSLKGLRRRGESIKALRRAVNCLPDKADLHFYLGEALAADRPDEARARLEHALKIAEPNVWWRKPAENLLRSLRPGEAKKGPNQG